MVTTNPAVDFTNALKREGLEDVYERAIGGVSSDYAFTVSLHTIEVKDKRSFLGFPYDKTRVVGLIRQEPAEFLRHIRTLGSYSNLNCGTLVIDVQDAEFAPAIRRAVKNIETALATPPIVNS